MGSFRNITGKVEKKRKSSTTKKDLSFCKVCLRAGMEGNVFYMSRNLGWTHNALVRPKSDITTSGFSRHNQSFLCGGGGGGSYRHMAKILYKSTVSVVCTATCTRRMCNSSLGT